MSVEAWGVIKTGLVAYLKRALKSNVVKMLPVVFSLGKTVPGDLHVSRPAKLVTKYGFFKYRTKKYTFTLL